MFWFSTGLYRSPLGGLFITIKLELTFSQFIHKFKIEIFWVLVLGRSYRFLPIRKEIRKVVWGFWRLLSMDFSIYSNSRKIWKVGFSDIHVGYTPIFPIPLRVEKLRFMKFPWFHILSDCENSLSDTVCLQETQFMIKFPVFKKKKYLYLYNNLNFPSLIENKTCKFFLEFHQSLDRTTASGINHTYLITPHFARTFHCMK